MAEFGGKVQESRYTCSVGMSMTSVFFLTTLGGLCSVPAVVRKDKIGGWASLIRGQICPRAQPVWSEAKSVLRLSQFDLRQNLSSGWASLIQGKICPRVEPVWSEAKICPRVEPVWSEAKSVLGLSQFDPRQNLSLLFSVGCRKECAVLVCAKESLIQVTQTCPDEY